MELPHFEVVHNEAQQRFEAHVDGQTAFLAYRQFPDRFVLVHTEVPPAVRGEGIAARLVAAALDYARGLHQRVIPLCPYVVDFIVKHPEYRDVLSPEDLKKIPPPEVHAATSDAARADELRAIAFYEIARRAKLTDIPELVKSPAFQRAKQLYEARAQYLQEAFQKEEAVDDYIRLRVEGALIKQGKNWQDAWAEFAPASLEKFPLPPGAM